MSTSPATVRADHPLGQRLLQAPLYPLRGAGLAALAAFAVAHALTDLLPLGINIAGGAIVWGSILIYAMECLRRTSNGFADPPDVTLYSDYGPAVSMLLLQVLGFVALVLALGRMPSLWMVVLAVVLLLPAIAISLSFEDHLLAALNPLRWTVAIGAFGLAYLLPVLVGALEDLAYVGYLRQAGWFGKSLWFVVVVYLCMLQFHVLGMLVHRHHEALGHTPEADELADATGRDDDDRLLAHADKLVARGEPEAAETALRERLRERHPPLAVFAAHRKLLRQRGDRQALLEYAHTHLTRLLSDDQVRPALGLVRECIELDPDFLPDQPESVARLADAAQAQGMTQLALKLARGYPNAWPRDPRSARYGLMAARLLADPFGRVAEAGVLASKLLQAFPDSPERPAIEQFMRDNGMRPEPSPPPT